MTQTVEALVLDLLEWLSLRDRSYEETLDPWRTSCPRVPVWEEANEQRFIRVETSNGRSTVRVTPAGSTFLQRFRPKAASLKF